MPAQRGVFLLVTVLCVHNKMVGKSSFKILVWTEIRKHWKTLMNIESEVSFPVLDFNTLEAVYFFIFYFLILSKLNP